MPHTRPAARAAAPLPPTLALALLLAGCAGVAPPAAEDFASFVVLGPEGVAVARVLSAAPACPAIELDGRMLPMTLRAPAATLAPRQADAKADAKAAAKTPAKAAAFPVLSCEATLPAGTGSASVLGRALPLPRAEPQRIVVIGDTGCRLKQSDSGDNYQACNDAEQYPFATVAAAAAAWRPDLVIHVGDYHYREHPCPAGNAACAGSPWGYGWDAWQADFFTPGAALLRAAPWVLARGNHESCERAGQGWWRLLDPRPLQPGRDCNAAADDAIGDYSEPYAIPLGQDTQLLVLDTAATSWRGLKPGSLGYRRYQQAYRQLDALARRASRNIGVNHHPLLGFGAGRAADGGIELQPGDAGLQQAFGALNPLLLPERIQTMLSGHVHLWQQVSFSSAHPSQFIAGFSGTAEDIVPLPAPMPPGASPAPGAVVEQLSSWIDGFGFMTMQRQGAERWLVRVHDRHGALRNTCRIDGRHSRCALARVE